MGMYTKIFVNVDFIDETPDDIIDVCDAICNKNCKAHSFKGRPIRWGMLFNSGSYYTPDTEVGNLVFNKASKSWSLIGKGDIKNYEREIQGFFKFIAPWVEDDFMGYYRDEGSREPTLVFRQDVIGHSWQRRE